MEGDEDKGNKTEEIDEVEKVAIGESEEETGEEAEEEVEEAPAP